MTLSKQDSPIRRGLLQHILGEVQRKYTASNQPFLEALYKTAFLLAYHGLMRVGELTLSQHVVKVTNIHKGENKNKLLIILYSSKTHGKESRPQRIRIETNSLLEVTDPQTENRNIVESVNKKMANFFCPVKTTKHYLSIRPEANSNDEPLLVFSDKSPLRSYHLRNLLREILTTLNLKAELYDTHSFRIGKATDMFKDGYSIDKIKHMGRWKSNAIYKYLRD